MTPTPLVSGSLVGESMAREVAHAECDRVSPHRLRAWRTFRSWWSRVVARHGPASSPRALFEGAAGPLLRLLGFSLEDVSVRGGRAHLAAIARTRQGTRVAVLTAAWNATVPGCWRDAVSAGTRVGSRWCLVFDGPSLGVVDASRPFARRHVAVSLKAAAAEEDRFAVLWALLRADRFDGAGGATPFDRAVDAADRRRALTSAEVDRGVRDAHALLRGALAASAHGRGCATGSPPVNEQALTVVFRLLFLLYAEARGLLPVDHPIYREAYSMASLGRALEHQTSRGWWLSVRAIMRMAHSGCRVRDLFVTAFNGRLFSPDQAPLAEHAHVEDAAVRAAVAALTVRATPGGRSRPVPYGELGVEQLGAVYERLIDAPETTVAGPRRASLRKATGSFYTPSALTHFLVRRTLAPLVEGAPPADILRLRVLDPAMGSGAFLVAACRYLASSYERALVAAGSLRPGDASEADRAGFRRLVAQRCLYGVDRNPMAVQLARLSLWLTTLARDRPLGFLDHRLRAGDSLVGASLADLARQPAGPGRGRHAPAQLPLLASLDPADSLRAGVAGQLALAAVPDDDADIVRNKQQRFDQLQGPDGPMHRWRLAADAWCAAWFWPAGARPSAAVFGDLLVEALRGGGSLHPRHREPLLADVREIAARQAFFHWPFEFPEVFSLADGHPRVDGGFDAILGNPPWDMVRAEDGTSQAEAAQLAEFARASGLYSHGREAHVNRYQLFVERALDLLRDGGRLGLLVPWGLLGDAGAARVRRRLFDRASVDTVVALENRRALFPIHRSVRFLALSATRGAPTHVTALRTGDEEVEPLERIPDHGAAREHFPILVTREALAALSGESLAVPAVRDGRALDLLLRLSARHPALADPMAWGARFSRELNATDDRPDFLAADSAVSDSAPDDSYPIVEGKHLAPFAVDLRSHRWRLPRSAAARRRAHRFDLARLAFRDVAGAGNRLTLIAAVLPAGTASVHTVFCLDTTMDPAPQRVLCALLNSLVANWYVRHWVSTHVTTGLVARLPVPWLRGEDAAHARLALLAERCEREGIEGDAWVDVQAEAARAYGLTAGELANVLETFPLIERGRRDAIARRVGHR